MCSHIAKRGRLYTPIRKSIQATPVLLEFLDSWLKLIAGELGFHPELSTKAGRKTSTNWYFNSMGLTTDAGKGGLGRSSASGLEVYGRPGECRIMAAL